MKLLSLAGLVLLALPGCDSPTEPSDYTDTVFTLQDAVLPNGSGVTTITPSTITFRSDGGLGIASCNDCDGVYRWESNELVVSSLGCTEIACGDRLDLGAWLYAERIVVSDTDNNTVTLVAEQRDGEIATFSFSVADR